MTTGIIPRVSWSTRALIGAKCIVTHLVTDVLLDGAFVVIRALGGIDGHLSWWTVTGGTIRSQFTIEGAI